MGGQQVVDLFGVNVLTAANDHVLDAIDDENVSVFVHDAHITGMQVAAHEGLGGFFRPVEVALHDHVAADADFSSLAPRAIAAVLGQYLHLLTGKRQADGADLSLPVPGVDGAHAGGLGEPVAFHDGNAECLLKILHGCFGQWRRATDAELQTAQIVLLAGRVGKQNLVNRRYGRPKVDLVPVHHLPELGGGELPPQNNLQPDTQCKGARQHCVDVKQGQKNQGGHVLFKIERPGHPVHICQDVLVGQQNTLGVTGGAGGVENVGRFIGVTVTGHWRFVPFSQKRGQIDVLGSRVVAHLDDFFQAGTIGPDFIQDGQVLVFNDQAPSFGVVEQVLHLRRFPPAVNGACNGADLLDGKVGHQGLGAVLHQYVNEVTLFKSLSFQGIGQDVHLSAKLAKGNGLVIKLQVGLIRVSLHGRVQIGTQIHGILQVGCTIN